MKRLLIAVAAMLLLAAPLAVSWGASSQKPFPESGGTNQTGKCPTLGLAQDKCAEGPGADKQQPVTHGDCKNPGTKSDGSLEGTGGTTGNHQGYDCVKSTTTPPVCTPTPTQDSTCKEVVKPVCTPTPTQDSTCKEVVKPVCTPTSTQDATCKEVVKPVCTPTSTQDATCKETGKLPTSTPTPQSGTSPASSTSPTPAGSGVLGASSKKNPSNAKPASQSAPASSSVPTSSAASPVSSSPSQGGLTG